MLDLAIIGGGVIGLSTAYELARRGAIVNIFSVKKPGRASEASAGLLAPSMGTLPSAMRPFFMMSLAAYPSLIQQLQPFDPGLKIINGLIEFIDDDVQPAVLEGARHLSSAEVYHLEPNILAPHGALLHAGDGSTDNERLVRALENAVRSHASITVTPDEVAAVEFNDSSVTIVTRSGGRWQARRVVLAAGAWAPHIAGLPRDLPVVPLKGQMLAVESTALRHPIVGADVYLVPRENEIVIGATTEHADFDLTVNPHDIEALRSSAIAVCPGLASATVVRTWAGLRPATPDLFPILGADPREPQLIYACGHSKNGILLAAGTAIAIASVTLGNAPTDDLTPFSIARFDSASHQNSAAKHQ